MSTLLMAREADRVEANGNHYVIYNYLSSYKEGGGGAQAFRVHLLNASGRIKPHFHEVPQYQVIVGGTGFIGKHSVSPGAVHYTDSYTPYGPILSGPDGIEFLTLRLEGVRGSLPMPESRDMLPGPAGYTFGAQIDLAVPAEDRVATLVGEAPNGARVFELRTGGHQPLQGPDPESLQQSGYYVVLGGDLSIDGQLVTAKACIYHEAGEPHPVAKAGRDGATVAFLVFPTSERRPTRADRRAVQAAASGQGGH